MCNSDKHSTYSTKQVVPSLFIIFTCVDVAVTDGDQGVLSYPVFLREEFFRQFVGPNNVRPHKVIKCKSYAKT